MISHSHTHTNIYKYKKITSVMSTHVGSETSFAVFGFIEFFM